MMLEIKNLKKSYDAKAVLSGLCLSVKKGEIVSIMGQSGSGKTTLLRIICALEKHDSGAVLLDGEMMGTGAGGLETRRKMSLVFQKPLAFNMSVFDNVAYGLRMRNLPEREILPKVTSTLWFVGIGRNLFGKNALNLSGGEMQRVALARSIVIEPELLLLDEPTANLDDANAEKFERLLLKVNREKNISVILSTHNKEQARRVGKKLFELKNGKLVMLK